MLKKDNIYRILEVFFVDKSYIERKIKDILEIIRKLKGIIEKKIEGEE